MPNHYLENDAVISDCGKYRYLLRRTWDHAKPRALLIMLNPSTADARQDDATIRSCVRLLTGLGYGSMEVVNLFAFRATDPREVLRMTAAGDPVGARNQEVIECAASDAGLIICAWGTNGSHIQQAETVLGWLSDRETFALGLSKEGHPRHPLYLKADAPLLPMDGTCV